METFELPLFPLHTVLFPGQTLPLHIFEPRYRQMVSECMQAEKKFGVVLIREGVEAGGPAKPYDVGTTAKILQVERLDDGRMNIVTLGQQRFLTHDVDYAGRPYLVGRVSFWPWSDEPSGETALSASVQRQLERYIDLFAQVSDTEIDLQPFPQEPAILAALVAAVLQVSPQQKQQLLEIPTVAEVLGQMRNLLRQENRALQIQLASSHLQGQMDHSFSNN